MVSVLGFMVSRAAGGGWPDVVVPYEGHWGGFQHGSTPTRLVLAALAPRSVARDLRPQQRQRCAFITGAARVRNRFRS